MTTSGSVSAAPCRDGHRVRILPESGALTAKLLQRYVYLIYSQNQSPAQKGKSQRESLASQHVHRTKSPSRLPFGYIL